jgi:lysophospholipase L1-like esterase
VVVAGLWGCGPEKGADVDRADGKAGSPASQPVVLIIGDSISMQNGYFPGVVERLGERYAVVHNPGNGSDSANVLAHVNAWLDATEPDIVHFNCGLHDLKLDRETGAHQQPPGIYEMNLREIVRRLKARPGLKIVFALTTPVNEERHRARKPFDRLESDVRLYNAMAVRIMKQEGIAVNDLYSVIMNAGRDDCLVADGVHMNEKGSALLAAAVASAIEQAAAKP